MVELKPCPFCGGEAKLEERPRTSRRWIFCLKCFVGTEFCASSERAIKIWNRRVGGYEPIRNDNIDERPCPFCRHEMALKPTGILGEGRWGGYCEQCRTEILVRRDH